MNKTEYKRPYTAPRAEVSELLRPLSLLASMSAEGGIADWEEDSDEL